jgi:hypothetical protein
MHFLLDTDGSLINSLFKPFAHHAPYISVSLYFYSGRPRGEDDRFPAMD